MEQIDGLRIAAAAATAAPLAALEPRLGATGFHSAAAAFLAQALTVAHPQPGQYESSNHRCIWLLHDHAQALAYRQVVKLMGSCRSMHANSSAYGVLGFCIL